MNRLVLILTTALVPLATVVPMEAGAAEETCGEPAKAYAWCDQSLSADERAELVVDQLTLGEQVKLATGVFGCLGHGGAGYVPGIKRLGVPAQEIVGAGMGVDGVCAAILPFTRSNNAKATELPAPLAMAASFDPEVALADGRLIGTETRALGFNVSIGGAVNLARDPRAGRTFEGGGEDPVLAGRMTAAQIRGIQSQHVAATVKHFALNNQEKFRLGQSSDVSERTMRELELLAFEIAIDEGDPATVMCSYNKVNGTYACENKFLLTDVLKKDWGFPGWVMTDWWSCAMAGVITFTGTCGTAKAANAGLDQEQPNLTVFGPLLSLAALSGKVSSARMDDMSHRILRSMFDKGLFDHPVPMHQPDVAAGSAVSQAVAEKSAVLLKNDGDVLPLDPATTGSIAVIGAPANQSPPSPPPSVYVDAADPDTPLQGLRDVAPKADLRYDAGTDPATAAALAAKSDVAIVYARNTVGEGSDLADLSLDAESDSLIAAVAAANPRTVVVLLTGTAVTMPWIDDVPGVLEAWYPGQRGGHAIANLLFGRANPSGRLPITFPVSEADLPVAGSAAQWPGTKKHISYAEELLIGYRWYDARGIKPLFPFGHGLSYGGEFTYSDLKVTPHSKTAPPQPDREHELADVQVTVTNTGTRKASAVPQLYAALPTGLSEPPKRLVAWDKVELEPGESTTVSFSVDDRDLAYWSTDASGWAVAPGAYRFIVGASAGDLRLDRGLTLTAP